MPLSVEMARLREERTRVLHRKAYAATLLMLAGLAFIALSLANGALMALAGLLALLAGALVAREAVKDRGRLLEGRAEGLPET